MPKAINLPNRISPKAKTLLFMGLKHAGTYEPDKALSLIEEELTFGEFDQLSGFLKWIVQKERTFGRDNIDKVYREFYASQK